MLDFTWPTDYVFVTSPFGRRRWPWPFNHEGIDIRAPYGTPIYAAADGLVAYAGPARGYGKLIMISHPTLGNIQTHYGHMSAILVEIGQNVSRGQKIALSGHGGVAKGDHLHFGLMVDGKLANPERGVHYVSKKHGYSFERQGKA